MFSGLVGLEHPVFQMY